MQDQGKRLLIAVALALGVMMIWQVLFPPDKPKPKPPGQGSAVVVPQVQGSPVGQALPPPAGSQGSAVDVGSGSAPAPVAVGSGSDAGSDAGSGSAVAGSAAVGSGSDAGSDAGSGSAVAEAPLPAFVEHDIVVPADANAKYTVMERSGTEPLPVLVTRRVGATGTTFAKREFDCAGRGVRLLAEAPTVEAFAKAKPEKKASPVVDGTIADVLWHEACDKKEPAPVIAPAPVVDEPVAIVPCTSALQTFTFKEMSISTSTCGGAITSWKLLAKKYDRERNKGEMVHPQGKGALLVNFASSTHVVPPETAWTASNVTDHGITYTWDTPDISVEKTFTFIPENFLVKTRIVVTGKAGLAKQTLAVSSYAYQDPKEDTSHARGNIEWKAACLRGEVRVASAKSLGEQPRMENGVSWAGFTEGYVPGSRFSAAQAGQFINATSPRPLGGQTMVACNAYAVPGLLGVMQVDLIFPPADIRAGDPPVIREMYTYIGPTSYEVLEAADTVAGYSTGFKEVPDFGWFGIIGRPLLWLLHKLYGLFGNWGLAIVFLTIIVKASTLYFTTRSMRSMKAMAALAPKMKELQEKYKDDRAKLQQETMGMYKQYGVNPLAGCLPILLQMPIWIALYRMLSSAGELYLEPLIPGWISDLTSPDPYHILPVVLIATMFAQAKLQPQTTTGFQQKLLMYGLPLMFGVASFFFPSGLSLYIVTNTILSALHSIYMNKYDKKGPAMVQAIAKQAVGGAGGAGGAGKGGKPEEKKAPAGGGGKVKPTIEVEDRSAKAAAAAKAAEVAAEEDDGDGESDDADEGGGVGGEGGTATEASVSSGERRRGSKSRRKRRGRN
jgi:YidC/Oxa1 family membrane protein insertase